MKRSGRRPGKPDTREEILVSARELFATLGFDRASVRRIAAEANVDPALVHHYFGSKNDLFLAAVDLPFDPAVKVRTVAQPGVEGLGERLIHMFVTMWDSPAAERLVALFRAAHGEEQSANLVRKVFESRIMDVLNGVLGQTVDHIDMRANLVASQLFGLAMTRYILRLQPLASLSVAALVTIYAPTVQRYLTMDLSAVVNE
ncbi:TetR family transcriptional regulator [Natronoglycomyces albus]|uniref:TetR family transcriptional regulator n=1 Tax=Natronoglycomyces albus TaxID=2811108 RepID=A0A895XXH1_9ACTN|nr:TetR family transcriptional regulator [Natronoglycomyces albus]